MAQLLLPVATIGVPGWDVVGALTHHGALAVQDLDVTRVQTQTEGSLCEVRLAEPLPPASNAGWEVRIEYRLSGPFIAVAPDTVGARLALRLKEGATQKWAWAPTMFNDTAWRVFVGAVPPSVAATISTWSDLRLELEDLHSAQGPFVNSRHQVSWLELSVADGDPVATGGSGAGGVRAHVSALAPAAVHVHALWP